jgi:serpin B
MKPRLLFFLAIFLLPPAIGATQTPPPRPAIAEANNAFAIDLYSQLRSRDGNLFFSPESISTALAMTYAGARNQTAVEMAKTLHFTLPPGLLHPAMGALLADLNAPHAGYQLQVANALWAQQGYPFRLDFLKLTNTDYAAGLNQVDFKSAPDAARATINEWVAQKTEDKIKDLIAPGELTRETRLVLTNAIYFKGDWDGQFDKTQTSEADFHISPSQTIKAPQMHRQGAFNYFDGQSFQALEIPYKSKELSMIVFLPVATDGLPAFEQSLTPATLQKALSQLRPEPKVILTLPKFKMTQQFGLAGTLSAMGMRQAFQKDAADFSGMIADSHNRLYISAVIHKAYIDVNEEGTEAAAATGILMARPTAVMRPRPPVIFRADHPFLFLIRDNRSGSILFLGRVADPAK